VINLLEGNLNRCLVGLKKATKNHCSYPDSGYSRLRKRRKSATDSPPSLAKRANQGLYFRKQNVVSVYRFRELRPLVYGFLPGVMNEQ
jgi:hypothetical protein